MNKKLLAYLSIFHTPGDDGAGGGGDGGSGNGGGQGGGGGGGPAVGEFVINAHVDDKGNFKPGWSKAAGLPEAWEKKFTQPVAALRSYAQLERQNGAANRVVIPGDGARPEDIAAYRKAIGVPDKAEDYGFTKPAKIGDRDVPDSLWNADRVKSWGARLHAIGVPKAQASAIIEQALGESLEGQSMIADAAKQSLEQSKAALVKEWGADYDANVGAAMRAAEKFGGDALKNHPALGNDVVLIKALAAIGKATAERPGANIRQQAGDTQLSASEALAKGNELTAEISKRNRANQNWKNTPEAAQMKAEKTRYFQMAYPEKA